MDTPNSLNFGNEFTLLIKKSYSAPYIKLNFKTYWNTLGKIYINVHINHGFGLIS